MLFGFVQVNRDTWRSWLQALRLGTVPLKRQIKDVEYNAFILLLCAESCAGNAIFHKILVDSIFNDDRYILNYTPAQAKSLCRSG